MGDTWEVSVWSNKVDFNYRYERYWGGECAMEALAQMQKARDEGYGCIKLEWRP